MSHRIPQHVPPYVTNSLMIRQEIQRFESVHPCIYALYDLIEEGLPENSLLQRQLHDYIVCIEDSFVNSQEWTLSRSVPDIKLGILGSVDSGKSALVHRYLTGSYLSDESPEGGRFKKEVIVDGQSHLLLLRDEGGMPEMQFSHWVDAVIFVFSLENEASFSSVYAHFARMAHYRDLSDLPMVLVGTQDTISESSPRVIDDARARKLAADLKNCTYHETCATYGLNVERVFQDICQRIMHSRHAATRLPPLLPTPNMSSSRLYQNIPPSLSMRHDPHIHHQQQFHSNQFPQAAVVATTPTNNNSSPFSNQRIPSSVKYQQQQEAMMMKDRDSITSRDSSSSKDFTDKNILRRQQPPPPQMSGNILMKSSSQQDPPLCQPPSQSCNSSEVLHNNGNHHNRYYHHYHHRSSLPLTKNTQGSSSSEMVTEHHSRNNILSFLGTPLMTKKLREKNNSSKKDGKQSKAGGVISPTPVKQGFLYKRSTKPLRMEWKKKYVTLFDDGRLVFHSSIQDFTDNVHGKEIELMKTAVKVPGRCPRGSELPRPQISTNANLGSVLLSKETGMGVDSNVPGGDPSKGDLKKRHRRLKSGAKNLDTNEDVSTGLEFLLHSLDNQQWHFKAQSSEDREDWVLAIEQQILFSLQQNISDKLNNRNSLSSTDSGVALAIRSTAGNHSCADCGSPNPDWASLNLGVLICIECSGIHRNLGTHLSRVRSLDLDDWPSDLVAVLTSVGNTAANSIFEANTQGRMKPSPSSPREEKEKWIRAKYERKSFLPPLPYQDVPVTQQLMDAVARQDVLKCLLVLAYCTPDHVNTPYSRTDTRTALHIAAALANVVQVQLLLWHGANVFMVDHENHYALFYARSARSQDCVRLLLAQGCPDISNPTPPPLPMT